MPRVYFDNAATTPMSEVALTALVEQSRELGNASSLHGYGREVRKRVEESRESLAALLECHPSEVIFTGSGTEANNLAIKGIYWSRNSEEAKRKLILISAFEHHAVLDPANWLAESEGAELIEIPVDPQGYIDLEYVRDQIDKRGNEIALISVMHSNNEIGTIQPIRQLVELANSAKIPVHTDAIQSFGKVPLSYQELGVFAMTVSAHKVGGPIGIGALVLRRGEDVTPLIHGGGQERDIRSGTVNAASIVAFATAAGVAIRNRDSNTLQILSLREKFVTILKSAVPDATINGGGGEILPGIINIRIPRTESDSLLLLFDNEGIACSTGSACTAGVQRPSHVLMAMGLTETDARSSLRFSFGPENTEADLEYFSICIARVVERARAAYRNNA